METANFGSLIRTICWIFFIYYAIKFLARLLLPVVAKKVVEKASEQFQKQLEQQQNYNNQTSSTNQTSNSDKPRETKKVGDYVDFEEID